MFIISRIFATIYLNKFFLCGLEVDKVVSLWSLSDYYPVKIAFFRCLFSYYFPKIC